MGNLVLAELQWRRLDFHLRLDKRNYTTYYLAFVKGQHWLQNKICKNYGHIGVIKKGENSWTLIDPAPGFLNVERLGNSTEDIKTFVKNPEVKLVKINVYMTNAYIKKFKLWHLLLPHWISCTKMVEYIIGTKLKGYTPYQVLNNLMKQCASNKFAHDIVGIEFL